LAARAASRQAEERSRSSIRKSVRYAPLAATAPSPSRAASPAPVLS